MGNEAGKNSKFALMTSRDTEIKGKDRSLERAQSSYNREIATTLSISANGDVTSTTTS